MPNGKTNGWAKRKPPTLAPAKSDETRRRLGIMNPFSTHWRPMQLSNRRGEQKRT